MGNGKYLLKKVGVIGLTALLLGCGSIRLNLVKPTAANSLEGYLARENYFWKIKNWQRRTQEETNALGETLSLSLSLSLSLGRYPVIQT